MIVAATWDAVSVTHTSELPNRPRPDRPDSIWPSSPAGSARSGGSGGSGGSGWSGGADGPAHTGGACCADHAHGAGLTHSK